MVCLFHPFVALLISKDKPPTNCIIKIVVVGNANAGKTSLIKRYCYNEMTKNYKATIGTDFAVKTVVINNITVMIQFVSKLLAS